MRVRRHFQFSPLISWPIRLQGARLGSHLGARWLVAAGVMAVAVTAAGLGRAVAAEPRIDLQTCEQLRQDHAKFVASGIEADVARGPEWAGKNLTPERLRDVRLFILLDEQVKFGCRQVNIDAAEAAKAAAEEAKVRKAAARAAKTAAQRAAKAAKAAQAGGGASLTSTPPSTP